MGFLEFLFGTNKRAEQERIERERAAKQERLEKERFLEELRKKKEEEEMRRQAKENEEEEYYKKKNTVGKKELGNTILKLSNCLKDVIQCKTMLQFYAPMGEYTKQLSLLLQAGNMLTEFYETIFCYGKIESIGIKGFSSGKFSEETKRQETLSDILENLSDVYLMLANIKITGYPEDSQMAIKYLEYLDEIKGVLTKLSKVSSCTGTETLVEVVKKEEEMFEGTPAEEQPMEQTQKCVSIPNTEKFPVIDSISESFDAMACQANYAFHTGNQQMAVHYMNQLFDSCYGQNGHKLLNVSAENCQPVGMAFANIAIYLNFNDRDLNSVAAENAFYCLARNFMATGNTYATPALFTLLLKHHDLLKDKLISTHCLKAEKSVGIPIGVMLGGNPYHAPHLEDFREQAVSKRIPVMSYLLQFIYDTKKSEYKVPTDMPFLIPTLKEIESFKKLTEAYGSSEDSLREEGEYYFYALFEDCQDTLTKC